MIRRDFVKYSSTAAASASLFGSSKAWSGANDRIRVGIIGMGGRGGYHMHAASKFDGVEAAAIADPDRRRLEKWSAELEEKVGKKPACHQDLRHIVDDPSIDAVIIASSNHWHALAGIWAMQAGKHAYVEKPVSHNVFEGRKLVEAARKYNRICQGGTQRRSSGMFRKAVQLLREGVIGDIYMARALVYGARGSIGFQPEEPIPEWLDWQTWLGPAQEQAYHQNLVHYNWHWFWDFGNGDLGNNGSHILDVVRWGINRGLPAKIHSCGGRFGYEDQGQTPNTQLCTFEYDDGAYVTCEVRGLYTNSEAHDIQWGGMFYGTQGYMAISDEKYEIFLGRSKTPEPPQEPLENIQHQKNFFDAIRAGDRSLLTADIEEIHQSCAFCLLGNISYRLGRRLHFDPRMETFLGDADANQLLTRNYRAPFVVPERV
ncbi:MAG: Gfo/Idh/MocA family oxidoreductase [Candidatus Omnitrophica bacterium]|nr:Gfo/Idh/MocA family oxidoreductase [Candidatus Omnitrophota bacterium]